MTTSSNKKSKKNQIFIILAVLRRSVYELRGPSPRLSAWATQLRRNVATVACRWRHYADLTGPGMEPQTSRTDSVRLATELTAGYIEQPLLEIPYIVMVPNIALYHSGVGAVVSPVSFYTSPSYVCFLFFLTLFSFNRVLRPCLLIPSSSSFILASMIRR